MDTGDIEKSLTAESVEHPTTQKTGIKPSAIEQVLQDVYCPNCQYNLRGMLGNDVQCPECGEACDIAKLVAIQWTKPWHKAPYFNKLCLPLFFCILVMFALPVVAFTIADFRMHYLFLLMCFAGWLACLAIPYHIFKSWVGVWLSLLLHASFAGLIGGAYTFVICSIWIFVEPSIRITKRDNKWLIIYAALIVLSLFVIWLSRKAEKFVARKCINRYLERIRGKSDTVA
jgi:hypothetical protein